MENFSQDYLKIPPRLRLLGEWGRVQRRLLWGFDKHGHLASFFLLTFSGEIKKKPVASTFAYRNTQKLLYVKSHDPTQQAFSTLA